MPNHYHLLVRVPFAMLRRFVGGVQQSYAQYHHRRHGTYGVLWQGRFHSQAVSADESLVRFGRYIERNAVRAKMVGLAWEWPYCSARWYVDGADDGITDADPRFGKSLSDPDRRNYAAMLQEQTDDDWMRRQQGPVIGTAATAAKVLDAHSRPKPRRGRPPKSRSGRISLQTAEVK